MIDAFGHIGYVALVAGTWMVGRQRIYGWAVRAFGSAIWMALGYAMALSSIWMWSGVFLVTDCVGFYRWRVKDKEQS